MEEKKLSEKQKRAKTILDKLKSLFSKPKKEIIAIRVISGSQKFWCRNPKKIKFWKTFAESRTLFSFNKDIGDGSVRITKVIYKE